MSNLRPFVAGREGRRSSPLVLTPSESELRGALDRDLFTRGRFASLLLIPILLLLRSFVAEALSRSVAASIWFGALLTLAIVRVAFLWIADPGRSALLAEKGRLLVVTGGALCGATFASFTLTVRPFLSPVEFALVALCASGFSSVALTTLFASRTAFFANQIPILGALAVAALAHPDPELGGRFALLVAVYAVTLGLMADHAHRSLAARLSLEIRLRELARRDGLTQLYNRRFVAEYVEAWAEKPPGRRASRSGADGSLGVVVLDIDHFKLVNDVHGHDSGDAVLKAFAALVGRCVRSTDIVARWGGEEFVILAPGAGRESLRRLAERVRRRTELRSFALPSGTRLRITCSAGYTAVAPAAGEAGELVWESVFAIADRGLLHAKATGRNRTVGVFPASGVAVALPLLAKTVRLLDRDGLEASPLVDVLREATSAPTSGPIGIVPPSDGTEATRRHA